MSTDEGPVPRPVATAPDANGGPSDGPGDGPGDGPNHGANHGASEDAASRNWWHRDHPVFSALSGFFTGLALVIVIPGAFAAILNAMFTYERAEDIFPLVLLIFVIPLGLIAARRTRRFGKYLLLGMALTAVVVLGVAALVLWILYSRDS